MYSLVHRRLEQNAEYFRNRNVAYKGLSFNLAAFLRMFFGKSDVLQFTQANYNAVPTEP